MRLARRYSEGVLRERNHTLVELDARHAKMSTHRLYRSIRIAHHVLDVFIHICQELAVAGCHFKVAQLALWNHSPLGLVWVLRLPFYPCRG